jgi:hypothetical protein
MQTMIENQYTTQNLTDKNGYSYQQVQNDENGVRIYTLKTD